MREFIDGAEAIARGALDAGCTFFAGYPITPATPIMLHMIRELPKVIQAEDEIASIGMVVGAGWNGARAFTSTSGPGISLMNEFIGLAYFAEIPATIINVQRGGPSTGMPTRTQQSDVLACAHASHGDTKHVLLFPEDPAECFGFAAEALDLADRLQTPVFVMSDLDIGMNQRLCAPFRWDDARRYDRGKVMTAEELEAGREFARYKDVDGDGIPYRTLPGTHPDKGAYFTRGTSRDPQAKYSERGADYLYNMQRLLHKFETAKALVPQPVVDQSVPPAAQAAIFYGSTSPAMAEAVELLRDAGIALDSVRIRAFPFARGRAEPRRPVAQPAGGRIRDRPGAPGRGAALRRHPDHRALHRRCDRGAVAPGPHGGGLSHDLSRQAQAPPPEPALQRARVHPPRLRGHRLDPVRGLRP